MQCIAFQYKVSGVYCQDFYCVCRALRKQQKKTCGECMGCCRISDCGECDYCTGKVRHHYNCLHHLSFFSLVKSNLEAFKDASNNCDVFLLTS